MVIETLELFLRRDDTSTSSMVRLLLLFLRGTAGAILGVMPQRGEKISCICVSIQTLSSDLIEGRTCHRRKLFVML